MAYNAARLKSLAISESGLVFDPGTGVIYTTNQTGLAILSAMRDGLDSDAVKERILEEFDIDEKTAERDILDFIDQLTAHEVIRNA